MIKSRVFGRLRQGQKSEYWFQLVLWQREGLAFFYIYQKTTRRPLSALNRFKRFLPESHFLAFIKLPNEINFKWKNKWIFLKVKICLARRLTNQSRQYRLNNSGKLVWWIFSWTFRFYIPWTIYMNLLVNP